MSIAVFGTPSPVVPGVAALPVYASAIGPLTAIAAAAANVAVRRIQLVVDIWVESSP